MRKISSGESVFSNSSITKLNYTEYKLIPIFSIFGAIISQNLNGSLFHSIVQPKKK